MRRSRKKGALGALAAALAFGAFVSYYVATRPKPLLQSARVFCEVKAWSKQTLYPTPNCYYWLGNNDVLISTNRGAYPPSPSRVTVGRDGKAGSPSRFPNSSTGDLIVSPNGKFVAYLDSVAGPITVTAGVPVRSQTTYLVICSVDAEPTLRRRWVGSETMLPDEIAKLAWAPDNRSLYYLQTLPRPCICRMDMQTGKIVGLPLPPEVRLRGNSEHAPYPSEDRILGFTSNRSVLIGCPYVQTRAFFDAFGDPAVGQPDVNFPSASLIELSLDERPKVIRTYSPANPHHADMGVLALSPRGDRLLWGMLCAEKPSALEVRLHRFLPGLRGEASVVERGWVSHLDGSDMKEIGYYTIPGATSSKAFANEPWILDPKWTPDGKRISFLFKDRIMTVPVD